VTALQNRGMEIRQSYQYSAVLFTIVALVSLMIASASFNEKKHCKPATPPASGMWKSMKSILSVKAFRLFLIGELFFQFAIFMLNLGLLYYVVVIFRQEESFLTVIGGLTIAVALISFPYINKLSKKIGKKKPLLLGVLIMTVACCLLFILSWNVNDTTLYIGVTLFGLGGLSLSTCTILTIPTYADMAREEALRTGVQREAMYYAARNLPLKITIALAGATFSFLISAFGKDIANPFGIQLSLLVIAVFSLIGFFFFAAYPEKQIQQKLSKYEDAGSTQLNG
jgi:glycoside/pentoside/hexuronide:cation symporter, GPH family